MRQDEGGSDIAREVGRPLRSAHRALAKVGRQENLPQLNAWVFHGWCTYCSWRHCKNGPLGPPQYVLGRRAEKEFPEPTKPMRAHHDQPGLQPATGLQNRFRWVSYGHLYPDV